MAGIADKIGDFFKGALVNRDGKTNPIGVGMTVGLTAIGMILGNFLGGGLGIALGGLLLGGLGLTAGALLADKLTDPKDLPADSSIRRGSDVIVTEEISHATSLSANATPSALKDGYERNLQNSENTIEQSITQIRSKNSQDAQAALEWYNSIHEKIIGMKVGAPSGPKDITDDLNDLQVIDKNFSPKNATNKVLLAKLDDHFDQKIAEYAKKVKQQNTLLGDAADVQTYTNHISAIPTLGTSIVIGAKPRYHVISALDALNEEKISEFHSHAHAAVNTINTATIGGMNLLHGENVRDAVNDLASLSEYIAKKQELAGIREQFNREGVAQLKDDGIIAKALQPEQETSTAPAPTPTPTPPPAPAATDSASLDAALKKGHSGNVSHTDVTGFVPNIDHSIKNPLDLESVNRLV